MADVVLFGTGQIAEVVYDYLRYDSEHKVVACALDADYIETDTFHDVPIVPFDQVEKNFHPDTHLFFTAIGFGQHNQAREQKYQAAKSKGYKFLTYISSQAHVWPTADIGENTFIMEGNVIQPHAKIGNNVIVWSGNHIGHHTTIKDHCFVASHAVISGGVTIGEHCFVGVNATIRDNISIGGGSVVGAGALVLKDAPANSLFKGVASEATPLLKQVI
ncbi:MAG: acetyltransferase [Alphaproteobacteria bacterium]